MFSPNQRNAIYKAVELQKLNVRDFKFESMNNGIRVTHKLTQFYFRFQPTEVKTSNGAALRFYLYHTPSRQADIFSTKEGSIISIDSLEKSLPHFSNWLALLKQEFEQPDLWAEMEQAPDFFAEQEPLPEDAFTPAEIKLLEARAEHIEQQLSELDLPAETEQAIAQAVREVPEKSKRLTKKEMGEILLSSVLREGFKAALSKDTMLAVWHLLMNLFTLAIGQ